MTPELSRPVRVETIGDVARDEEIVATAVERTALAARFDLIALESLTAKIATVRDVRGIRVTGRVFAAGDQACAVSAEPVPFALDEVVDLTFSEAVSEEEVELVDLDILPLEDATLDLGEIAAQSLGLGLDPYPRAPDADRTAAARFLISEAEADARAAADKAAASPFASLQRPT